MLRTIFKSTSLPMVANWGVLILRVGISLIMLTHGYPKLSKFLSGDHSFADPINLGSELSFILVIGAEFFCSILLILGLGTRVVLIPLIFTMLIVFFIVHGDDPFGKKEVPALFLIIYLTLLFTGPGRFSIDRLLFKSRAKHRSDFRE